jgi:hypothetical protein
MSKISKISIILIGLIGLMSFISCQYRDEQDYLLSELLGKKYIMFGKENAITYEGMTYRVAESKDGYYKYVKHPDGKISMGKKCYDDGDPAFLEDAMTSPTARRYISSLKLSNNPYGLTYLINGVENGYLLKKTKLKVNYSTKECDTYDCVPFECEYFKNFEYFLTFDKESSILYEYINDYDFGDYFPHHEWNFMIWKLPSVYQWLD